MGKNPRRKKNKKKSKSSCANCDKPDEGEMVLCDWCENWFHFSCVDLVSAPTTELWKCPNCTRQDQHSTKSSEVNPETPIEKKGSTQSKSLEVHQEILTGQHQRKDKGAVKKDPNRQFNNLEDFDTPIYSSVQLSLRTADTGKRTQIELQKVEEEKELIQKMQREKYQLEQQYLERKYEILLRANERRSLNSSIRKTSTEEWINKIPSNVENVHDQKSKDIDMDEFVRRLNDLKMSDTTSDRQPFPHKPTEDVSKTYKEEPRIQTTRKPIEESFTGDEDGFQASPSKPKFGFNQKSFQPSNISAQDNWNAPLPGGRVLTRAQIASRQVVTKDLPIFTGTPEDWLIFHKRYVNSTELCGYSDGENLDRLQKCLKGDAYDAVQDLLLDSESVQDVINTLEMLFGRPELIVKSLLKKLRKLPIPKVEDLNSIVSFALDVKNLTKTVERKKLHQYLSNPILLQELVDRLPTTYKVDWAKYIVNIPDNSITLVTLSNWLTRLMQALIKVTEFVPKGSEKKNERSKNKSKPERINVHQEDKISEKFKKSESQKEAENKCQVCSKRCISIQDCEAFKSLDPTQRWKVIYDNKLCRKCLRRHGGYCRVHKECGVNNCIFKHHSLLHDDQKHKSNQNAKPSMVKEIVLQADVQSSHLSYNMKVILRIIPIKVFGNGISLDTFAFLDDGSTATLIDQKLADELQLVGVEKDLCLIWSANIHRREKNSRQVEVLISATDNPKNQFKLREVKTVRFLGIPSQRINKEEICRKFPHLKDVPFISYENGVPGILIGSNNPRIGIPREVVDGGDCEPIAARTLIGWTVHGSIYPLDEIEKSQMNHYQVEECKCKHDHDESLHQSMKDYFSIDNFGVQVPSTLSTLSKNDERAMQCLQTLTRRIDKHFETGLLWRYENFVLPESYFMAKRRLECLENKKPETIRIVDDIIRDYVQKGYARKLNKEEALNHNQKHWYLPIFTVTSPKKPDKQRMVFDAAAKVNGVSLNTMLLKGPDQLASLVGILRRFREKRYAIAGDIREMFHQIRISKDDQQCQRFLWRNGNQSKDPDVYIMQAMTFGAACSPCAAHFVKNKNASDYSRQFPRAAEAIVKNHYMDDMMEGENSEEELIQLAKDVHRIHSQAGFEIRNFLSNSEKVMKALGSNTEMDSKSINPDKEFDIERVLGMWWNILMDCFTYSLKFLSVTRGILNGERFPTKRELLKLLMSIFDPLGLISHYLIHLKIAIQDVWRSNLDWDEPITSKELIEQWQKWLEVLPTIEKLEIPRFLTPKLSSSEASIDLHTFVDAGDKAFGAVTFLRVEDESGVDCSLIGKSRVAPLKYLSIPRKELQSGLLGSRLAKSIGESQTFKVNKRIFWTDSSTLLSWLASDQRKYHQFVAHRVGEILENTNLCEWRWVPSKFNVADDLTKWPKYSIFDKSNRWFNGPAFLKEHESKWPMRDKNDIEETNEEIKVIHAHNELIVSPIFDSKRFSNWTRMVKAVAYAIRFIKKLKARIRKESISWSYLTRDEFDYAQNVIYRQAQFEGFTEEMVILELNKTLEVKHQLKIPKSSSLTSCSPYLDDAGVLRVRGRTDYAKKISTNTKRPIIMPRKNWITKLLVGCYHRIYHHRNHETVVNEVRQKFYIPKLRVVLKSIVTNDCQLCKNRRAKPQPPEEGNLPAGRLAIGFRPFTHTGIDYFGPMKIIQGRSEVKRWGVLFTCLTIRAVHVEIAYTMTTQSCIKCIRNFINLRGQPSEFYSDSGTNLVGTDKELQKALKDVDTDQLAQQFTTSYCKWNFNPPESKHMGGAWERLIRSVKTCLYDIMPMRRPNDEMFRSLLMEVMNVVNSRPLTFIPLDNENDEALSPNHFLLGSSNGLKPPGDFDSDGPILRSEWKEIQRLTDCFWRRFVKEYVPTLTRKTKWFQPVQPIDIDDIVLVIDEKNSRNIYPKARVVDRIIGSNNQVRRVRVQFANGSILWRSAAGLARLDISNELSSTVLPDSQTGGTVEKAH